MCHCRDSKNDNSGKLSQEDRRLVDLAHKLTDLSDADIDILIEVSHTLPFISALEGGEVYIDILTKGNRLAVVAAQHSPPEGNFFNQSLIGNIMWRKNEPGVYRTLEIGVSSREFKAVVSDQEIIVSQNASAIVNSDNKIIGALIRERNLQHQDFAGSYGASEESMGAETISSSKELQNIAEYMDDAVILFNTQGVCTYANPQAQSLFMGLDYKDAPLGLPFDNLSFGSYSFHDLVESRRMEHNEIKIGKYNLKVTCNTVWEKDRLRGAILVIKDTTEIKKKETELILKSTVIDEIHHRIKNNLQTIVSLIGLQSNRMDNEQVKAFSRDIISRIYSISLTHEIMAYNGVDSIEVKDMLSRMLNSSMNYIVPEELDLNLEITGSEIWLQSDTATTIAMVINELIQNSIKHAFIDRQKGRVTIHIEKGEFFSTITITDDGVGFYETAKDSSMGLKLVRSLVKDKLKGDIKITSEGYGTKARFTFIRNENP